MSSNSDDVSAAKCLLVLLGVVALAGANVPSNRYEALMAGQSLELGLYNASDKVTILTTANFKETVLHQNRSALVEFYNSYCGHCKRFAPYYKQLAAELHPWRDVLRVAAIDCAAEENNDICREYEVMGYPTLRYFGPGFTPTTATTSSSSNNNGSAAKEDGGVGGAVEKNSYGRSLNSQDLNDIRTMVAEWLAAENRTANMPNWPPFDKLTEDEARNLFEGLDSQHTHVALVYEPENSTVGVETILHLRRWPALLVRRIGDPDLAAKYQIDGVQYLLATVDRHGAVVPYRPLAATSLAYAATLQSFLRAQHFTELPDVTKGADADADAETTQHSSSTSTPLDQQQLERQHKLLLAEVHRNRHFVYQADLEMAIRGMLFNEVPKVGDISGERLLALQRFLALLKRYNPLGKHGRALVADLHDFVLQFNDQLTGRQFEEELMRLEAQRQPAFAAHQYVGCVSSLGNLRGFTCSVWQLFHFLSVQAATSELSQDPLEVLQAMHGYVKYFFGCTDCAEHFQAMATRRKIWSTPNKDEAVLWLWAAHNEVNERLAGDETEDPEFPKIQFPNPASCGKCYKEVPQMSPANVDIMWNKDAVLSFLRNIHNPAYVSRYGVERADLLEPPAAEKLRRKRMLGNVFSDIDMRMGMLLYGFCIVMMVVAFKLFVFKGYRKKPYAHDMLGKV